MSQVYIKSSNSLSSLADALIKSIAARKDDVFRPVFIVTQTDGMSSWLKLRIAETTGIAANLVFLKPNELINKIYFITGGRYESSLTATDIQWLVFKTLGSDDVRQNWPRLVDYFIEGDSINQVKRIALAQEIADLFDQYQIYRSDMLLRWSRGERSTESPHEEWQMGIWNEVKKQAGEKFPDRSRLKTSILRNLTVPEHASALKEAMPEIYFFGTSLVTSFHHEILLAISEHIPAIFYLPNPSPHIYWYDDKSQKALFYQRKRGIDTGEPTDTNPLLINWGKLVQNTFQLFFKDDATINQYEETAIPYTPATLLESVQNMVHENTSAPDEKISSDKLRDGSLTIKSSYNVVREVEALYNYLIKLMDTNPGKYSTRDIVVHVTDINKYSSYIRAVFENAPYRLKYTIADESYTISDTISQALYQILTLEEKSFTSENVVQLLNFSSVRRHFKITDTALIRRVVAEAGIRHGVDGNKYDESVYVSWRYGLKRIMYGICISSDEEYEPGTEGFFPLDSIEGADANEVIHFVNMVNRLIGVMESREEDRSVRDWISYIYETLRLLIFDEEEKDSTEYQQLTEHINSLLIDAELFEEEISFPVFLRQFLPGLMQMAQTYKFARGGITFCSLIPMRSIPFKIVAMLGLDFDKFPRKPMNSGFDLMHRFPKPGDRDIKVNDKHLFLETIMSAGDYLYLSYIGQRPKDNSKLPPSILVDELISFIEASSEHPDDVRSAIFTAEPLHGFSTKYGNKPGYYNYLLADRDAISIGHEQREEHATGREIDIIQLYRFLCNPIEWYFKNEIGIYFDNESVTLPDTEPIELDHLERWKLKSELLLIDGDEVDSLTDRLKKTGVLPLKSAGLYEVSVAAEETATVKSIFNAERGGEDVSQISIEADIGGNTHIKGTIDFVFGRKILVPCFSGSREKYLLKAWLFALLAGAAETDYQVVFVGERKHEASRYTKEAAKEVLRRLLSIMEEGRKTWLPFHISWRSVLKSRPTPRQLETEIRKQKFDKEYLDLALSKGFDENFHEKYYEIAELIGNSLKEVFNL